MKRLKASARYLFSSYIFLILLSNAVHAASFIGPITASGNALLDNTNQRFMVRGIALGEWNNIDPLADVNNDAFKSNIMPILLALKINSLRVYGVNLTGRTHGLTMALLQDNNIFVQIDLATNDWSINRASPQYDPKLVTRFETIVKTFSKYPNVLTFIVGNEVTDPYGFISNPTYSCVKSANRTNCANGLSMRNAAIVKAIIRDLRVFQKTNGLREIPIGAALRDTPTTTQYPGLVGTDVISQYYACATTPSNLPGGINFQLQAGFVGINAYRYLPGGDPSVNTKIVSEYLINKYNVPVWFTESDGTGGTGFRDFKDISYLFANSAEYDYISGQNVYQLFNGTGGGGNALYDYSSVSGLTPIHQESVTNLTNVYNGVPSVPVPPSPTDAVPCPDNFNPVVPGTKLGGVTIDNSPNSQQVNVVQFGNLVTTIPAGQKLSIPNVTVGGYAPIYLLSTNWYQVCEVDNPQDGSTYIDNVAWGFEVACNEL